MTWRYWPVWYALSGQYVWSTVTHKYATWLAFENRILQSDSLLGFSLSNQIAISMFIYIKMDIFEMVSTFVFVYMFSCAISFLAGGKWK